MESIVSAKVVLKKKKKSWNRVHQPSLINDCWALQVNIRGRWPFPWLNLYFCRQVELVQSRWVDCVHTDGLGGTGCSFSVMAVIHHCPVDCCCCSADEPKETIVG